MSLLTELNIFIHDYPSGRQVPDGPPELRALALAILRLWADAHYGLPEPLAVAYAAPVNWRAFELCAAAFPGGWFMEDARVLACFDDLKTTRMLLYAPEGWEVAPGGMLYMKDVDSEFLLEPPPMRQMLKTARPDHLKPVLRDAPDRTPFYGAALGKGA